jgi:lipopolysaccharide transport system permease protein
MNKEENIKEWDLTIEPQNSLFKLNLKDVWRYRDLLGLLVRRDFVAFYKQTILGPLWFFIQPLFTTFTFVFVFGNLAGLSTDGLPQPLFYMTGVVAWSYFSDCITKTSTVFRDNANIFGKVYFPRLIMPLSITISNLVKLGVQFVMLLCIYAYFILAKGFIPDTNISILLVPVYIVLMAGLGLGVGMIISAMTTKYRDLSFLVTFGVQLLMYATPVIYPLASAPENYKWLIKLNPMSSIIEGMRYALLGKGDFTLNGLLYSTITTLVMLAIGTIVFNKVEKSFVDTV